MVRNPTGSQLISLLTPRRVTCWNQTTLSGRNFAGCEMVGDLNALIQEQAPLPYVLSQPSMQHLLAGPRCFDQPIARCLLQVAILLCLA